MNYEFNVRVPGIVMTLVETHDSLESAEARRLEIESALVALQLEGRSHIPVTLRAIR